MPEGTGRHGEGRSTSRRALFVGAVLLVAFGFVVLGGLTSDSPTSADGTTTTTVEPTTTTTDQLRAPIDLENFSVEQLETGPQFEWKRATIDRAHGYPIGFVEHDGVLYLFSTVASDWRFESGGLVAWRSNDGVRWESLGQVIDESYRVSRIESTPQGLVAAGSTPDRSAIMIWTSSDGAAWESEEIAVQTDHPHIDVLVTAVGANQDAFVVMSNVEFDGQEMLEQRLTDSGYDLNLDFLDWGTSYDSDEGALLRIGGPLGLPGIEIPLDELGLTEEEQHWVQNGYNAAPDVRTWTRATGSREWVQGRLDGAHWVESIMNEGDGTMLLTGWSGVGAISRRSTDGIEWTEPDSSLPSNRVYPWRDGLLAIDEHSRPELLYTSAESEWKELGLADHFPRQVQWSILTLAAGEEGVVFSVNGYENPDSMGFHEPVEISTDEGHVLLLDLDERVVRLDTGGASHEWEIYRPEPPPGLELDLSTEVVTFADPHTGETLIVLTFEELLAAEQTYYSTRSLAEEHHALVYSPDGSEWRIQAISSVLSEDVWIGDLELVPGRIVMVTLPRGERFNPFVTPDLDVWTADIP